MENILSNMKRVVASRISRLLSSVDSESDVHGNAKLNRFAKIINSSIDRYSYIGPRTRICNANVGSFCSISWDCFIGLASHPSNLVSTSPIFFEKHNGTGTTWVNTTPDKVSDRTTSVGSDVWIGANCIVLEGVRIGHGAIVGAGSVVTKSVQPYSIVGGVPAKHIRFRFQESIVAALLEREWWNASDADIQSAIAKFSLESPSLHDVLELPAGRRGD